MPQTSCQEFGGKFRPYRVSRKGGEGLTSCSWWRAHSRCSYQVCLCFPGESLEPLAGALSGVCGCCSLIAYTKLPRGSESCWLRQTILEDSLWFPCSSGNYKVSYGDERERGCCRWAWPEEWSAQTYQIELFILFSLLWASLSCMFLSLYQHTPKYLTTVIPKQLFFGTKQPRTFQLGHHPCIPAMDRLFWPSSTQETRKPLSGDSFHQPHISLRLQ